MEICCQTPGPPKLALVLTCVYMTPPTSTFLQNTLLNDQDFCIRTCGLVWLIRILKKSFRKDKIPTQGTRSPLQHKGAEDGLASW